MKPPAHPDTDGGGQAREQEPRLEPAVDKRRLEGALERVAHRAAHVLGQVAPQQQAGADDVGRAGLPDQERQVRLRLVEQTGCPLGEDVERLDDGVGARDEDDPGQEERDLPRPGHLVQLWVPVLREQTEEAVDGI